jgi:hypothetical protein
VTAPGRWTNPVSPTRPPAPRSRDETRQASRRRSRQSGGCSGISWSALRRLHRTWISLFAAQESRPTRVIGQCLPRPRHLECLAFLKTIDHDVSKRLKVISSSIITPPIATPRSRRGSFVTRFELHFTPTSSSLLNMIAIFLAAHRESDPPRHLRQRPRPRRPDPDLSRCSRPQPATVSVGRVHRPGPREGPRRPSRLRCNRQLKPGRTTSIQLHEHHTTFCPRLDLLRCNDKSPLE